MKNAFLLIVCAVAPIVFGQTTNNPVKETTDLNLERELDNLFSERYPENSPGAAVLIAKDDQIVYRKSFGMANMELGVKMKPENVMQIASITKQFTSVSILLLLEQGKLNLQDPLSKFITDYPRGNEITLHHLLNHSSGIESYTNIPEMRMKMRLDLTPEELINSFKDLPLQFNPGEQYSYSNSGYILLGYIIEKVSGLTYEAFIKKYIFDQVGMQHSYYASAYTIFQGKANGYQIFEGNIENAEFMSPTIPYAAGSLLSTIDDLFLWNKAMHHNTLISEKTKQLAFTNHPLNNGKNSNYGYGWFVNEIEGKTTLEHTGGINGFTASGIYLPSSNMYAIVLSNLDDGRGPESANIKAISLLLGNHVLEKKTVQLTDKQLKKWVGSYQFDGVVRTIFFENNALYSQREGGRPILLLPNSENEFTFDGLTTTYSFSNVKGEKQVLYADRIEKSLGVEMLKTPNLKVKE